MQIQVDTQEAFLVEAYRRLPPDTAAELSALATRLASLSVTRVINWSDAWSDEDLADFASASVSRLDDEEAQLD